MQFEIQDVSHKSIKEYIDVQDRSGIADWEATVLDQSIVKTMLVNGSYAKQRTAWVMVQNGETLGYAITHDPSRSLEMLHLNKAVRGKGLGEWFLRNLNIKEVVVDAMNTAALNLYRKLGYEIDFT